MSERLGKLAIGSCNSLGHSMESDLLSGGKIYGERIKEYVGVFQLAFPTAFFHMFLVSCEALTRLNSGKLSSQFSDHQKAFRQPPVMFSSDSICNL